MDLGNYWKNYGFEILVVISVIFILSCFIYRWATGKKGTWATKYYYNKQFINGDKNSTRRTFSGISKGEIECKRVLEQIFKKPFNKARPSIMYNKVTNMNLELDCYNSELKIACEYNGKQHYVYTPYFHTNIDKFRAQQYRDYMKSILCEKNGITLITVPYTVKIEDIESYIKNILRKTRYKRHFRYDRLNF